MISTYTFSAIVAGIVIAVLFAMIYLSRRRVKVLCFPGPRPELMYISDEVDSVDRDHSLPFDLTREEIVGSKKDEIDFSVATMAKEYEAINRLSREKRLRASGFSA